jgi:hypothetical protein
VHAYVDTQGNWFQRGEMGSFASNDKSKGSENYDASFWEFVMSLPDEQVVFLVDCHI